MRYDLFITRRDDGTFEGSVPSIPEIRELAPIREGAIGAVREALHSRLRRVEIVSIELPDSLATPEGPRQTTAGRFAGDPNLESMLAEIYAARSTFGQSDDGNRY